MIVQRWTVNSGQPKPERGKREPTRFSSPRKGELWTVQYSKVLGVSGHWTAIGVDLREVRIFHLGQLRSGEFPRSPGVTREGSGNVTVN